MTPTSTTGGPATPDGFVRLSVFMVEDLAWLIGILEDWLLHASEDACEDLAEFAGRGAFTRSTEQHARMIARQLGDHHVTLCRALRSAGVDI